MTPEDKQAECLRICGPNVTPQTHRMAPIMCPILWDAWLGFKIQLSPKSKGDKP